MVTLDEEKIVILGLARQGKALARFFAAQGAEVTISDRRSAEELEADMAVLAGLPVRYELGGHPLSLLDGCDLLCISGGVPADLPFVEEARRRDIPVSNDAQEFLRRSPAIVVGITGSAGKTTTTSLVGEMVRAAGFRTWVGGNIGNPLIDDLDVMRPEDRVVMELSSFQLELMDVSPQIAGVLNITPNHLDRHRTMDAYIEAKANIVTHQDAGDVAVLGYDDPNARALADRTPAQVRYFSGSVPVAEGAFLRDEVLVLRRDGVEREICQRDDVQLRGFHNLLNVLAAIILADAVQVPEEAMQQTIVEFTGVEHRLEVVGRYRGVVWVNDSIATAPERVLAALNAFDEPLVLLAGGRDKDLPWEEFAQRVVERVRVLILFGEARGLIAGEVQRARRQAAGDKVLEATIHVETLKEAVAEAARRSRPGDVVLLSPGGTSFDAFKDFAARGEHFRQWVEALED